MGNKCSGGFKSVRKRKRDIPVGRIVEEWEEFAVQSFDLLPIEVRLQYEKQ